MLATIGVTFAPRIAPHAIRMRSLRNSYWRLVWQREDRWYELLDADADQDARDAALDALMRAEKALDRYEMLWGLEKIPM